MAPKAGAVYRCRIVNIFGNRAVASQQDNRRQRKLAPYVDSDDRPHGQVWQAEPHEALSLDQAEHAQRPVQDTIGGIENPQPRDGSDRNRRNPRKKHEEAEQPFSRKSFWSASARALLSSKITTWENSANMKVFFSAVWNLGVSIMLLKLRRPTKPNVPPPVVVLLTL